MHDYTIPSPFFSQEVQRGTLAPDPIWRHWNSQNYPFSASQIYYIRGCGVWSVWWRWWRVARYTTQHSQSCCRKSLESCMTFCRVGAVVAAADCALNSHAATITVPRYMVNHIYTRHRSTTYTTPLNKHLTSCKTIRTTTRRCSHIKTQFSSRVCTFVYVCLVSSMTQLGIKRTAQ